MRRWFRLAALALLALGLSAAASRADDLSQLRARVVTALHRVTLDLTALFGEADVWKSGVRATEPLAVSLATADTLSAADQRTLLTFWLCAGTDTILGAASCQAFRETPPSTPWSRAAPDELRAAADAVLQQKSQLLDFSRDDMLVGVGSFILCMLSWGPLAGDLPRSHGQARDVDLVLADVTPPSLDDPLLVLQAAEGDAAAACRVAQALADAGFQVELVDKGSAQAPPEGRARALAAITFARTALALYTLGQDQPARLLMRGAVRVAQLQGVAVPDDLPLDDPLLVAEMEQVMLRPLRQALWLQLGVTGEYAWPGKGVAQAAVEEVGGALD